MNLRPLNSAHQVISCPQNGDRIVTVGTVASVYPMHIRVTCLLALTLLLRRTTLTASRQNRKKTVTSCFLFFFGATENTRPANAGLENDGQTFSKLLAQLRVYF